MAGDVKVNTTELTRLMKKINRVSKKSPSLIKKMFTDIGQMVQEKAAELAPRSMTKAEYVSTLKGGVTKRKTSSFTSTALQKSIRFDVKKNRVEIGVPSNSPAGKYAEKMHDEKGKSWDNLGKQNDPVATDKFIFKAYNEESKAIEKELEHLLDKVIKGIF